MKSPKKQPTIKEHDFQKQILSAFEKHPNIMLYRRNTGAVKFDNPNGGKRFVKFSEAGQSDLWGIISEYRCPFCNKKQYGVHVEIELKRVRLKSGKNVTELQRAWLHKVADYNGIVLVLFAQDYEGMRILDLRKQIEKWLYQSKCPECVTKEKWAV
jgi:hypothetical protein